MNKKVITIISIVAILIVIAVGLFLFFRNGGNVGFDSNIKNEFNKKGTTKLDIGNKKILVTYFSETGNTQKLAKLISDEVGGDFIRLETVNSYPTGQALFDYTKKERDENVRPELKEMDVNVEDYDIIFVGYPIWWYTAPMPIYSFFDKYDFSGKTIVPFNTHEGSSDGGTYDTIKQLEPNAKVLSGLAIRGGDMKSDQTTKVRNWLEGLPLNE